MGDTDCEGIPGDGALACHGAPENGWAGSSPGVCLPAANDAVGREKLEEVPWFCLDNCGSKGSGFACLYDQLKNKPGEIDLEHAQCVDVFGDAPAGFCEFQPGGYVALPDAECTSDDYMECCQAECGPGPGESCQDWGYPESYVCDAENVQPGNCVPEDCANPKNFPAMLSYCKMFW